ncbi:ribosome biogenesis protein ytm1 [Coemansia thaxteri]|uniref:Ribosome biogenesis protein ytm1 n=1 Tax=Coemansia thaxteri TaxID=2663907 RepID=A0A9W8BKL7_9FUNG|nr:ribosome biogenesis protein ytm1 [Coemansia thaxteri]KAJ2004875.1 ribosome biogenesis protein ytm1 [Coemansia thaxteri]KAJ2471880.1 ribosome biogenesis protein ytm1 [Coemansia sp. RSA 2322]KAJ2485124.1 ribosome biogenesis protein ytm1 [Coemansia sp. RSA 2320]
MSINSRRHRREAAAEAGAADTADFEKRSGEEQLGILESLMEEARASTYEAINSHHRDFLSIKLYGQDPLDEIATLNEKYGVVQAAIDPAAHKSAERLDAVGRALRAIVRLAKTHANLKEIDDQILHGDVAVAASSIAEIAGLLQELDEDGPALVDPLAVGLLHSAYLKKRAALKAELDYLMAEMYQINDSASSVLEMVVSYCVSSNYDGVPYENPVMLADLFFALANLDLFREKMDFLADAFVGRWFVPLLRNPNESLTVSRVKLFATINIGAYAASSGSSGSRPGGEPALEAHCALVRDKWSTVLAFIRDEVFHDVSIEEDHGVVYEYLGTKLWTSLYPLLHESLLVPMVPADIDSIGDTQHMVPLLELEEKWLELELITADQLFLKDSIRSLLQTFVTKRRRDLLTTVASVLASEDANTVVVGGEGPVTDMLCEYARGAGGKKSGKKGVVGAGFDEDCDSSLSFPRCSISVHAQTLVDFALETVGFTVGDDSKAASLYFYAVRDAFALYRCLMPSQWSATLQNDPMRAFVLYNDCEYICHHLATLGFRYRDRWPAVLRSSATFVDVIAAYRALSKVCLSPVLSRLRDQISRALGPSEWLRPRWLSNLVADPGIAACYEGCETQLALACGIVAQVAHTGAQHLSQAMYLRVIGLLADVAVAHVSKRLEEIESASDATARALVRLVSSVVALEDLFRVSPTSLASSVYSESTGQKSRRGGSLAFKHCKEWEALQTQISRLDKMASHIASI